MNKLIQAHKAHKKAERALDAAVKAQFAVGDITCHNKGASRGNWIWVQVEMVGPNQVKVWNPETGKSQWVHYYHFLPEKER